MSTERDHKKLIEELEAILDNYTEWFMGVVRVVFYPDACSGLALVVPAAFDPWLVRAYEKKLFPEPKLDDLKKLAADLGVRARALTEVRRVDGAPPPYPEFDKLATFFEEFISLVRRLQKEYYLGISGIDPQTGLRSRDMFFKDIERELERLERHGKPFCLALVHIDHFKDMSAKSTPDEMGTIYNLIAAMIKKSTRSFDDAYAMEEGIFVLSLKQTGMTGGVRALQRLNALLAAEQKSFQIPLGHADITLSSCIAEPLPEDNIKNLLTNMKKHLGNYPGQREGALIQYMDISPLERMAKSSSSAST